LVRLELRAFALCRAKGIPPLETCGVYGGIRGSRLLPLIVVEGDIYPSSRYYPLHPAPKTRRYGVGTIYLSSLLN
jgi:hypothetical protein